MAIKIPVEQYPDPKSVAMNGCYCPGAERDPLKLPCLENGLECPRCTQINCGRHGHAWWREECPVPACGSRMSIDNGPQAVCSRPQGHRGLHQEAESMSSGGVMGPMTWGKPLLLEKVIERIRAPQPDAPNETRVAYVLGNAKTGRYLQLMLGTDNGLIAGDKVIVEIRKAK
jgi:hypothetical protein